MHVSTHTHTHTHIYIYIYIYMCVCVHVYVCIYNVYVYVYVYVYIYVHTYKPVMWNEPLIALLLAWTSCWINSSVVWWPGPCCNVRRCVSLWDLAVSRDLCLKFSGRSEADLTGRPAALLPMCLSNFRRDEMISDLRSRGFGTTRVLRGSVLSIILKWIPARHLS